MRLFSALLFLIFCQYTALAGDKRYQHIYNKTNKTWQMIKTACNQANHGNLYMDGKKLDGENDTVLIPPGTHTLDYTSTSGSIAGYIRLYPVSSHAETASHAYFYSNDAGWSLNAFHYIEIFDTRIRLNTPSIGDITLLPTPTQPR